MLFKTTASGYVDSIVRDNEDERHPNSDWSNGPTMSIAIRLNVTSIMGSGIILAFVANFFPAYFWHVSQALQYSESLWNMLGQ